MIGSSKGEDVMSIVRSALVIPAFISGLLMAKKPAETAPRQASSAVQTVSAERVSQRNLDPVMSRKLRIERVLVTLDKVAAVTLQMSPERSSRIEPVLVDLAEQTLALVDEETLKASDTDEELDHIESTLAGLMNSMNRMIEPEMSL
jgi:hypothetical protein